MVTTLKITKDAFDNALDVATAMLRSGRIIVYPTDTVYGIGCDALSEDAVKNLLKIKQAEPKPLSVMVGDFSTIEYYCETGLWEDMIISRYLPGPYTFILKKRRYVAASQTDKLGIRFPDNEFCQYLAQKFGRPIVTTSANVTGREAPTSFEQIDPEILDKVDLAIDGGETKYRSPSMVVDLVDHKLKRTSAGEISLIEFPER